MIQIIRSLIAAAAIAHGVNVSFADEVARCESTYRHDVISISGARGLYQLMPKGKLDVFYQRGYDDWADPAQQAEFFMTQVQEGEMWAWPTCSRQALLLFPPFEVQDAN